MLTNWIKRNETNTRSFLFEWSWWVAEVNIQYYGSSICNGVVGMPNLNLISNMKKIMKELNCDIDEGSDGPSTSVTVVK